MLTDWDALNRQEYAWLDQLGPLAREVFDHAPRELSAARICPEWKARKSPFHPRWNPDCKLNWKDPGIDREFAAFLIAEYRKRTGLDPLSFVLVAEPGSITKRVTRSESIAARVRYRNQNVVRAGLQARRPLDPRTA